MRRRLLISSGVLGLVAVMAFLGSLLLWIPGMAGAENLPAGAKMAPEVWRWGIAAAALATGLSSLAAAYAVAMLGTTAMGTLAEKPELFGRLLIFVGLAEGIAIYGVIVSVLILNKLV